MTRHARRGSKKSTIPTATPWGVLKRAKYSLLEEDEDGSHLQNREETIDVRKVVNRNPKVTMRAKLKEKRRNIAKKFIIGKRTLNISDSDPLLSSMEGDGNLLEDKTPLTKRTSKFKSVSFGEDSVLVFNSGSSLCMSTNEKKRKMVEARRLRRQRRKVCFNCRKAGHVIEDCPVPASEATSGICFKCGSAEHTSKFCPVSISEGYPYAKCFICKEIGHIARSCPDNPRGLFPNGGCCKLCGSVEHLKSNCTEKNNNNSGLRVKGLVMVNRASADADAPMTSTLLRVSKKVATNNNKTTKIVNF